MIHQTILEQLIEPAILALGLLACLLLFATVKREVRRNEQNLRRRIDELSTQVGLAHLSAAQSAADATGCIGVPVHVRSALGLASEGTPERPDSPLHQHSAVPYHTEQLPAPPQPVEPEFVPAVPRSGFHLNRRSQALRLLRRGEDIAHVAAALGVPHREVELLVRVQQLSASRTA